MAFSWKKAQKRAIKDFKITKQHYLRLGKTQEAQVLERKIKRAEDATS